MYKYRLTVLTPTYNRAYTLTKVYESLAKQTKQNFQWLIIDDGSSDGTEELIMSFPKTGFELEYHKKSNGGKHTALNYSHQFIKGEMVVILDSDDYLTDDAIETIQRDWLKFKNDKRIAGMSYMKILRGGGTAYLSKQPPEDEYISDHIQYRDNGNITGDQCEVIRSALLKKYPFPVFENEKFMSEGWLWRTVAKRYKTIYRAKCIYVCEYLEGGLTKCGRGLRMSCPQGMLENCRTFFVSEMNIKIQIKEMLLYDIYAICSDKSVFKEISKSRRIIGTTLLLPVGYLLYIYWRNNI